MGVHDSDQLDTMPMGWLISIAGHRMADRWRHAVERNELGWGATTLLVGLAQEDGLAHREIARRVWLSPATVTTIADGLEAAGLVTRVRDAADRRVVRLHLTEEGRARAHRAGQALAAEFGPLFPAVSPAEQAVVRRYLVALVRNLGEGDQP